MTVNKLYPRITVLCLLVLFSFLLHSPHTIFNVADRNLDFNIHYLWSVQFQNELYNGNFYPRWMPLGNFSLGEPAFLYYSPLFYFVTAFFRFFTSDIWTAIRVVEVFSTVVVGFFVWRLLKEITHHPLIALSGALLCQAAPMIFMLFYYFNGFPWASNAAGLAALLYYWFRPGQPDRLVNLPASLTIAIIIMTHIVSALMTLICLSFLVFGYIEKTPTGWQIGWRPILRWFLSAALGIGLAMVYLYPALTSLDLVASQVWVEFYTPSAFAFSVITYFLFGMRWFTFQWVVPTVSLLSVLFVSYYYAVYLKKDPANSISHLSALLLIVAWASLFFSSELSYPLCTLSSPLQKVQFPYRFLYVTAFIAVIANMLCLWDAYIKGRSGQWIYLGSIPLIMLILLTAALNLKITKVDGQSLEALTTDKIEGYSSLPEYYLKTQGPRWMEYVQNGGFAAECAGQRAVCKDYGTDGRSRRWEIELQHAAKLRLPVLFLPAWTVKVDTRPVEAALDPATGLIAVQLDAGRHTVVLTWSGLPQEHIGAWLSLIALGVWVSLTLKTAFSNALQNA